MWFATGSHLAKCLDTMPAASGVAVYEREMLARSTKTVLASRSAAVTLHSSQALTSPATTYDPPGLNAPPGDFFRMETNGDGGSVAVSLCGT